MSGLPLFLLLRLTGGTATSACPGGGTSPPGRTGFPPALPGRGFLPGGGPLLGRGLASGGGRRTRGVLGYGRARRPRGRQIGLALIAQGVIRAVLGREEGPVCRIHLIDVDNGVRIRAQPGIPALLTSRQKQSSQKSRCTAWQNSSLHHLRTNSVEQRPRQAQNVVQNPSYKTA